MVLDLKDALVCEIEGISLLELGEYGRAIEHFDEAIRLNPEYAMAYYSKVWF